jgi:hypothetical protein
MKPYFMEQAEALESWPREGITARARKWANKLDAGQVLALWRACMGEPGRLERLEPESRLLLEQVAWGAGVQGDDALDLELLAQRAALLKTLCQSRLTVVQRQKEALGHCVAQIELLSGFQHWLATEPELYQLHEEQAWWRPDGEWGGFSQNDAFVERNARDARVLTENQFLLLDQADYRTRALPHILRRWLWSDADTLHSLAAIIHFYTGLIKPTKSHEQEIRALREQLLELLPSLDRRHTALPMRPLYSLPREARNVYRLVKTAEDKLVVSASGTLSGPHATARAKLLGEDQLLLFDTALVLKRSGHTDAYMSVELESPEQDVLRALFAATEQLGLEATLLEHLPRIVMGCFTAAHMDRKIFSELTHEGAFWDTESGRRLCNITGFNPDNHKHRARVQQVRSLLCRLKLHREVVTTQGKRVRTSVEWEGPLIQPLQDRLELRREDQEGVGEQQVFQSWLIARELWNMTQPSSRSGGSPAFMLLDQRAFQLDPTSSIPFNLYWTLVNRAYMNHSRDTSEPFSLGIVTWCAWAGVEIERPAALRKTLVAALNLMTDHELLVTWSCAALSAARTPTLKQLESAQIEVIFHPSQARVLPPSE